MTNRAVSRETGSDMIGVDSVIEISLVAIGTLRWRPRVDTVDMA